MARPFILIGTVMFISTLIYSCLSFNATAAVFVLSAMLTLILHRLSKRIRIIKYLFLVFLAVSLSSGSFTVKTQTEYLPATALATQEKCTVSGTVIDISSYNGYFYYTLDNISVSGGNTTKSKIKITSKYYQQAEIDDTMTFNVTDIAADVNIPAFYLPDSDGVHLRAYSDIRPAVIKAEKHSVKYYLASFREFISDKLSDNMYDQYAGAVSAMMTGNKESLSEDIQLNFSHSGISHLFAVSGFHLSLWTSMIFLIFDKLIGKKKIIGNIFAVLFVVFFMAMTGFSESVVRSGIMMLIFLIGKIIEQKADSLNSLFAALSIILFINPYLALSTSLLMSFLATLGIVAFSGAVTEPVHKLKDKIKPKLLYKIIYMIYTTAMISIVATVFTCPVSALDFGYYSVAAPVTNLLCMPVAQLILPLCSIGILTSFIPAFSHFIFMLCNFIMKYIFAVTAKISSFQYAIVDAHSDAVLISLFAVLIITIILIAVFEFRNKQLRRSFGFSAVCMLIITLSVLALENSTVRIHVPDVGNGSAVICSIHGKDIVIGCGGTEYKEYVFTNTLNTLGGKNFELLLIPRNTETESEYAEALLTKYSFGELVVCQEKLSDETEALLPETTERTSMCNIKIDENAKLVYININSFHGARIESEDFTCTVLFNPTSDFSAVPESWSKGDLLITRQTLPEGNYEFSDIFISSNSGRVYYDERIKSTSTCGNLIYTFTPFTGAKTYADK